MSKIDGHWYHPPGQQKCWEFVLKCPRLWDNFPAGEFTGGELWALQKSMKALPRYQQREDFTWAFCLQHQAKGTLTTPGVLNQCSPPNQHREESNPKTDPWSTTKEWISLTSARLGTSFRRQFQKNPSGYTHWDIPQFTPCNATQQNNCAALRVTQGQDHSWNFAIPDAAIIWAGVMWDG